MTAAHGRLGLAYGQVQVTAHDPGWAAVAAGHLATLTRVLGNDAVATAHVGSTAVPGLAAKPIVDLAVKLAPHADPETVIGTLTVAGYLFMGEKADQGGILFVWEPQPRFRTVHVHVIGDGDPQFDRYLTLVERLSGSPGLAAQYGTLKQQIAAAHPNDRAAYTRAKTGFLQGLLADVTVPPLPLASAPGDGRMAGRGGQCASGDGGVDD